MGSSSGCSYPSYRSIASLWSAGRWPLLTGRWMGAARRGRMGRAPGGVYADSGPAVAPARASLPPPRRQRIVVARADEKIAWEKSNEAQNGNSGPMRGPLL